MKQNQNLKMCKNRSAFKIRSAQTLDNATHFSSLSRRFSWSVILKAALRRDTDTNIVLADVSGGVDCPIVNSIANNEVTNPCRLMLPEV